MLKDSSDQTVKQFFENVIFCHVMDMEVHPLGAWNEVEGKGLLVPLLRKVAYR